MWGVTLLLVLRLPTELPPEVRNELRHHEAEDDQVVCLQVAMGNANLGLLVQLLLPAVHGAYSQFVILSIIDLRNSK